MDSFEKSGGRFTPPARFLSEGGNLVASHAYEPGGFRRLNNHSPWMKLSTARVYINQGVEGSKIALTFTELCHLKVTWLLGSRSSKVGLCES
jgi:hypothetical protein